MKKYVLAILLSVSLIPTMQANQTTSKVFKNVLKGTWQVIKIGGGLGFMGGGAFLFGVPCCAGSICKMAALPCFVSEQENNDGAAAVNSCGNCCIGTGIILGMPAIYLGYKLVESGGRGLSKMASAREKNNS